MNNKTMFLQRHARQMLVHGAFGLVAALLLLSANSSQAQEWRLQPELRVGYEFDDNANLRSEPEQVQEIDGWLAEGSLDINYATPRTNFNLSPRVIARVYDETPDVDSNDAFLNFGFEHESLKADFAIRGTYAHETIRLAERANTDIDVDDPDDIPTDGTGLVFINEPRDRFSIRPEWNYNFTERTSFGLLAGYTDVSYDDSTAGFLIDYTDMYFGARLGRQFTPRTRGYVGAGVRQYENDDGTNDVDGVGAVVGLETELSQTTRIQAEVGYEDTEQSETNESDSNFVANFNVVRQLETVRFLAQYRRSVSPTGTGRVTERDSLNFNVKKDFTQRVAGGIGIRAYQTNSIGTLAATAPERDYTEFGAQLEVALSRAFLVEADYRYAKADGNDEFGSADSNSFILWLVYRPTAIVN